VKKWEDILRGRITLIGANGVVLADTERSPEAMENHLTRPEVKEALASGEGSALRYSATTNIYYLYFARRVETEGRVAVLRAAYPLEFLSEAFAETRNKFILYLFVAVVLILAFGTWLARLFFRPLDRIVEFAGKIAQGEAVRFPIMAEPELQRLSSALDGMSARLRGAMTELRTEREDLSRIVTALPVGVVLLDEERRVRYLNDVGKRLLCVKEEAPHGVPVERILPSGDMYPLVEAAMNGEEDCLTLDLPELDKGIFVSVRAGRRAGCCWSSPILRRSTVWSSRGGISSPTRGMSSRRRWRASDWPPNSSRRGRSGAKRTRRAFRPSSRNRSG
jgi:two-component system phosphate regulon sensor histidine kinase PhoR